MLDNEKIISCDWSEAGGVLEYDISDLHPDLGVLIQEYRISSMNYEGKRIYQSDFSLSGSSSSEVGDFSYLPKEAKEKIWDVVFMVANVFFADYQPDIVEHFIDGAYLLEKRYERYRTKLRPPGYNIELDKIKRTITYQKEEKGPAVNGGPSVF